MRARKITSYPEMSAMDCNTYLIWDKILVDPGSKKSWMDKCDLIGSKDIKFIILTHSHPDHSASATDASDHFGCKVGMHSIEHSFLRGDGRILYRLLCGENPNIDVDFYVDVDRLGEMGIEIIHTPGHTPGSICIFVKEEEALISGDLIFAGGVGRTDFIGGSYEDLLKSIEMVSELDAKVLLPGHGEILRGDDVRRNFEEMLDAQGR